ncbi:MAG TPA: non-canonical purine NTP pyrophosphatase [Pyrinomonadaceae bacterium]|nr:non-canonical purine NTP pyrophosphatase [Pyrinomonadaceae bacterium]
MQLLIATYNEGKVQEVREALTSLPLTLRTLDDFPNIQPVNETADSYYGNAVLKAVGYASQTGLMALADDSGLEVDALDGKPGVFSARFGGEGASNADRVQKLLRMLSTTPDESRTARFVCCLALAGVQQGLPVAGATNLQVLTTFEEYCAGSIGHVASGHNGFGYDPIFVPLGYNQTFGELPNEVKNTISHRGKALAAVRKFLITLASPVDRLR